MPGQAIVTINQKQWSVGVANTYAEVSTGLSGVASMPANSGVLFDLGYDQNYIQIDMSRMLFPLDIVFINSTQGVRGVMTNVQPGETDVRFEATITPGARCFLEVNAGEAEGIGVGDDIAIQGLAPQNTGLDLSGLMNFMLIFVVIFMMMRMVDRALEAPEKPKMLGYGEAPPGYKPVHHSSETGHPSSEEEATFPLEARKDLTFCKHMWDLEKTIGRPFTREEVSERWERWKELRYRPKTEEERRLAHSLKYGTEELPERGSGHHSGTKPTRDDVEVHAWQERDRLSIWVEDKRTGGSIAEWWNDEAREMFEQGFFKPGVPQYSWEKPSWAFVDSILDYLEETGVLAREHSPKAEEEITKRYQRPYLTNWQYGGYSYVEEDPSKPEELWVRGMADYVNPKDVIAIAVREGLPEISLAGGFWERIGYKGYGQKVSISEAKRALAKAREHILGSSSEHQSSPGFAIMPRLPGEARGDYLFVQYIRDLVKLGETVTDEEARYMWEAWKKQAGHHSMWLSPEQRTTLEEKYGAIATRWGEELAPVGDIRAVEHAASRFWTKMKEAFEIA